MHVSWLISPVLAVIFVGAAHGQTYPNKTIRIVTTEVGAGNDLLARIVALGLSGPLGQPVIVENRATTVSGVITAQASPDGYTLLLAANASWLGQFLQDMPYDAVRDFAPISTVSNQPVVLVVQPSFPAKTVKELIALAKARPGELNYGSSTTATVSHLAGELLKATAGIQIVRVPFKGAGPALTALIGGEVHMTFPTPSVVPQHVKAGRLRALAVSGLKPSPCCRSCQPWLQAACRATKWYRGQACSLRSRRRSPLSAGSIRRSCAPWRPRKFATKSWHWVRSLPAARLTSSRP